MNTETITRATLSEPRNPEAERAERIGQHLRDAKAALSKAICVVAEDDREQARRLQRLWVLVDAETLWGDEAGR